MSTYFLPFMQSLNQIGGRFHFFAQNHVALALHSQFLVLNVPNSIIKGVRGTLGIIQVAISTSPMSSPTALISFAEEKTISLRTNDDHVFTLPRKAIALSFTISATLRVSHSSLSETSSLGSRRRRVYRLQRRNPVIRCQRSDLREGRRVVPLSYGRPSQCPHRRSRGAPRRYLRVGPRLL